MASRGVRENNLASTSTFEPLDRPDWPTWLKGVSFLILLWTLLGCIGHLAALFPAQVGQMDPGQLRLRLAAPPWHGLAWTISAWSAFIGAIQFVRRRRSCEVLFLISLVATAIMYSAYLIVPMLRAAETPTTIAMRMIVLGIGALLVWLARRTATQGRLH